MTRTLLVAAAITYATAGALALPSCAWFKKEEPKIVQALDCTANDVASQVAVIIAQIASGNIAVVATIGGDLLQCVLAAAEALPTAETVVPGSMGSPHGALVDTKMKGAILAVVRGEIVRRKAGGK